AASSEAPTKWRAKRVARPEGRRPRCAEGAAPGGALEPPIPHAPRSGLGAIRNPEVDAVRLALLSRSAASSEAPTKWRAKRVARPEGRRPRCAEGAAPGGALEPPIPHAPRSGPCATCLLQLLPCATRAEAAAAGALRYLRYAT